MSNSDETFDALWIKTGLAGDHERPHGRTIRGSVPDSTNSNLPRLSIATSEEGPHRGGAQLILDRLLGEGGMGQVHLARQPALDREVAIKRVKPDAPQAAVASLFREARTMGSLEHPNILPVHAIGADDSGKPVLVMKRITGVEWRELIQDPNHYAWDWWTGLNTEPLARHVEFLIYLCRAVHFAHERGVLHLDIKPENAMLADDGGVYVFDWGIARRLDAPQRRGLAGTPAYMAPELVDVERPLDRTADVYLLGGCLHEVLTGNPTHTGSSLREVMESAHRADPPTFSPAVPEGLAAICRRCLAADPADRYATAAALLEDLTRWIRTRGAHELTKVASASAIRLDALIARETPDPVAVARAFAEARFGFERALDQWAESPQAAAGRRAVLRTMATFEIGRENLDHARALLADLGDHDLHGPLADAEQRVQARLDLAYGSDLAVSRSARSMLFAALALAGLLVAVVVLSGSLGRPEDFTTLKVVWVGLFFNIVIWVLAFLGRARLFRNDVNRSLMYTVFVVSFAVLLNRVAGHIGGFTVPQVFAGDLLVIGGATGVVAAFVKRTPVWLTALAASCMGMISAVWPETAMRMFAFSTSVGFLLAAVYWHHLGSTASSEGS